MMKTFRPLPQTLCPSDTSICTYPSCNCAISFEPFDRNNITIKSPNSSISLIEYYEPSAKEKYDYNYERIFGK